MARQIQCFGWTRPTFISANAEIQKKHDINTHTHAQKRTKMDTYEDGKDGCYHLKKETTDSSLCRKNDRFCFFSLRSSKNAACKTLATMAKERILDRTFRFAGCYRHNEAVANCRRCGVFLLMCSLATQGCNKYRSQTSQPKKGRLSKS